MGVKRGGRSILFGCCAIVFFILLSIPFSLATAAIQRTYTLDADFEEGILNGVQHETVHDQLQLSQESFQFPFIWVPSYDGTVSKVNTETGKEIGRYHIAPATLPPEALGGNPSRTTVDIQGNCWVGVRQAGTVVKIGLTEADQCVDRNGSGTIETSRDLNNDGDITGAEILPWGQDECVLYEVVLLPGSEGTYVPGTYPGLYDTDYNGVSPRGLAIDSQNNLWAGTWNTSTYYYINGATGAILNSVDVSAWDHNAYGAVIDEDGILWSAGRAGQHILRLNPSTSPPSISTISLQNWAYGIALDYLGHLFVTGWIDIPGEPWYFNLSKIDTASQTVEWADQEPNLNGSRGVVCTQDNNVWIANSWSGNVTRYDNDGNYLATIFLGYDTGPSGVAVDAAGKVWVCDTDDEYIHRIDPATNTVDLSKQLVGSIGHYSYSDMTGSLLRSSIVKRGTWTVIFNSGFSGTQWGIVSWNSDEPEGTSVTVRVRSSSDQATWSAWESAANGGDLSSTPGGRYIQIETTLQILSGEVSPILYDLTVQGTLPTTTEVDIDIKPYSFPNSINMKNEGRIPVAILSSPTFNAPSLIDTTSLTFGRTGDENSLAFCNKSPKDINGDGLKDLICHFTTKLTGFQVGDVEGILKGKTVTGINFMASDSVRIVHNTKGSKL